MLTCIILEEKGSCAGSFEDDTNAARGLSLMLAAWECQKRFYIVLIALFFISTLQDDVILVSCDPSVFHCH